ncbi:unnamed protein product [Lactuca saligna]|uniref:Uncharacterized protein n=1 Tax=Lactuca saligna TaxID=75948 RepID=A0AA36A321_LACSI|nr:unnamed protein product [Lactuca saligna]
MKDSEPSIGFSSTIPLSDAFVYYFIVIVGGYFKHGVSLRDVLERQAWPLNGLKNKNVIEGTHTFPSSIVVTTYQLVIAGHQASAWFCESKDNLSRLKA